MWLNITILCYIHYNNHKRKPHRSGFELPCKRHSISNTLNREYVESIFTFVVYSWLSTLCQLWRARTVDEYDVTITVYRVCVTSQGNWCHVTIDQSHRYGRHQAACREPAGSYDRTTRTAIYFEHKTQYLLIRAPYTRIVVFWHISNIAPWFRRVKLVVIPPRVILQQYLWDIVIRPAVGCYNSWANLRCSGCYPLGGNYCETGLL